MSVMPDHKFLREHSRLLAESFERLTGQRLPSDALTLYNAHFALVSHGTQRDPVFNYANLFAQRLFGYAWDEFVTLPSRLSAREPERDERARLLEMVTQQGYISDYCGVRVRRDGTLFRISHATVWKVLDADGQFCGQAAMFSEVEELQ
ncbi:MEKHLA domain-containing protein [Methyloversatilis sp.]|uniref:MEKHLA domain-containing protein n=1 Tax=Methyloversatilis sp. TaxID=2569862 RepID=UPI002735ABB6|nr:MEKHLA domain-containing protein [Methyloversatilis sp.]MDP2868198.1 MEKHLA domain-containing protein [Methyloversatilis sp.]MDP3455735.1 MEKHLA domain-containing protein [Methyloversatilis sp.]MDP3579061.1 MEKHLA domain-containing protein [Methyloversatilis sp.]